MIVSAEYDKPYTHFISDETPFEDSKLGMVFETREMLEDTISLLQFNCPDTSCDQVCNSWGDLRRHVKNDHNRWMWCADAVPLL